MKIKSLFPVLTIFSTSGAVATPIITTSCNNQIEPKCGLDIMWTKSPNENDPVSVIGSNSL